MANATDDRSVDQVVAGMQRTLIGIQNDILKLYDTIFRLNGENEQLRVALQQSQPPAPLSPINAMKLALAPESLTDE